jgi:predicted P-loop ATPase
MENQDRMKRINKLLEEANDTEDTEDVDPSDIQTYENTEIITDSDTENKGKKKKKSEPQKSWISSVETILNPESDDSYPIYYNTFKDYIVIKENAEYRKVNDNDTSKITKRILENPYTNKTGFNSKELYRMISCITRENKRNIAVTDEIPAWDGTDHIKALLSTVELLEGENKERFNSIMTMWLVGMIATVHNDDNNISKAVSNDIMPIFYSAEEGIGKTKWFQNLILCSFSSDYFETIRAQSAYENRMSLYTRMLLLYDELKMSKKNEDQLKADITCRSVEITKKYIVDSEQHARRASLCGTTNNPEVLASIASNRRFLVFKIKSCQWMNNGINYKQVMAQAKALWISGYRFWMTKEEINENANIALGFVEQTEALETLKENLGDVKFIFSNVRELCDEIGFDLKGSSSRFKDMSEAIKGYATRSKNGSITIGLKFSTDVIEGLNKKLEENKENTFRHLPELYEKLNLDAKERRILKKNTGDVKFEIKRTMLGKDHIYRIIKR